MFQLARGETGRESSRSAKDGLYTPEETTWVKIKNPQYSQMEGRRELFEKRAHAAIAQWDSHYASSERRSSV
jgi:hypothetical protein